MPENSRDNARRDITTQALYRDIAQQVVTARLAADMSQRQLAAAVGTTASVICRLESGEHRMSVETLDRICQVLNMHVQLSLRPGRTR